MCDAQCFTNKVVCQQLHSNTLSLECQWKEGTEKKQISSSMTHLASPMLNV